MTIAAALCLFASLALAAPGQLAKRLPDHTPVTVNDLDPSFDVNCGKITVKGGDIEKAVSWGVNLQGAGDTVGSNRYPHPYKNHEKFNFPSHVCKNQANNRKEFPVNKGGYFTGDNDEDAYKFRAIYVHSKGQQDVESHPVATYCGTIYHASNGFEGCDITKN